MLLGHKVLISTWQMQGLPQPNVKSPLALRLGMDLPLGSLGDPNVLPVDLVMDTVKWLPCQPDTGLCLPNLFKKSQEQESSKLL